MATRTAGRFGYAPAVEQIDSKLPQLHKDDELLIVRYACLSPQKASCRVTQEAGSPISNSAARYRQTRRLRNQRR